MPPKRSNRPAAPSYHESVFINCPFDGGYKRLFEATVFTVFYSGYIPRCALEIYNSGQVRIEKIFKLIESCQFGIHDISRTELDVESKLPRFNMPLELGMFLGAQRFGAMPPNTMMRMMATGVSHARMLVWREFAPVKNGDN